MTFSVIDLSTSGLTSRFFEGNQPTTFTGNLDQPDYAFVGARLYTGTHTPSPDPEILPKQLPFVVFGTIGSSEFSAHRVRLSWQHNNYFSPTCGTCRAGVGRMMGIVDYLNNRTILSTEQMVPGEGETKEFRVGSGVSLFIKNPKAFRFIVIPSTKSWQDVLNWIREIMDSAITGAHIKTLELWVDGELYQVEGTPF